MKNIESFEAKLKEKCGGQFKWINNKLSKDYSIHRAVLLCQNRHSTLEHVQNTARQVVQNELSSIEVKRKAEEKKIEAERKYEEKRIIEEKRREVLKQVKEKNRIAEEKWCEEKRRIAE